MNSPYKWADSRVPNRIQTSQTASFSLLWLELVHFCDVGGLTLQGETEISWHHLKEFQVSGDSIDIFTRALLKCTEQTHVSGLCTNTQKSIVSEVTLGCRTHNISVENKDVSISEKSLENLPAPNKLLKPEASQTHSKTFKVLACPSFTHPHFNDFPSSMEHKRRLFSRLFCILFHKWMGIWTSSIKLQKWLKRQYKWSLCNL